MKNIFLTLFVLIILSCASNKVQYSNSLKNWESVSKSNFPTEAPQYVLYGIGDAGHLPGDKTSSALTSLQTMLSNDTAPAGVVFLGDNIYPSGMPKKSDASRAQAEANINAQIESVTDFNGQVFITPGNHDWRQDNGQKGVARQEKYVENKLEKEVFFPNKGCPGPVDFKLSQDVALIIIDSEWYLQDWSEQIDFNEKCEYKTRYDFMYELTDLIKKYCKDKRLVIALHHPIFTYGSHGGKFSAKDNILPLSNLHKPINVPLPGLGFLYPLLRKNAGFREDINGDKYKELRSQLLKHTDVFDDIIFLAGHEHNMQYIFKEDHHHIIAGSGSKTTPVSLGEGSEFALAELGFTRLSFYSQGETWVEYYSAASGTAKLVFAKKITEKLTDFDSSDLVFNPPTQPYFETCVSNHDAKKGGLFRFFMGRQYSELYSQPLKARVTNLSIKEGGLTGVKRGGGFQTNSVRLEDSQGHDWVMRAMKKDASRLLPDEFVGTPAEDAVEHFLTTAHPLAAFTIAPMASSIDILHTTPELVYIPKQTALGEFNEDHGDQLYLFEDRPAGNRSDRDNFGNSEKIISTDDLIAKMKEKSTHRPDQNNVVRNRLFDMVIGDWDRHDDQWRWARFDGPNKTKSYKPVPRDRDQAYSIFEGLIVGLGRIISPGIGKFQTFDHKIKNVNYFNFNARYFDRSFMNEITWADWQKEIEHIQTHLTDETIHNGISLMQQSFYDQHGAEIEAIIKSRRDQLKTYAKRYYKSLAKAINVHGTNQDDLIEITKTKGSTHVKLTEKGKNGSNDFTYFERTFVDGESKEVRVYGLDGDDEFVVTGQGSSIKVRMLGGTDDDQYASTGNSGKNHVYDYEDNTTAEKGSGLKLHLSNNYTQNTYNRKEFKYNHSFSLPLIASNPDNGFLLGAMFTTSFNGFKKDPYQSKHLIKALYSFETEGFQVDYEGHFIDVFGKWNLNLLGDYQDEFFSNNFFGFGNETLNPEELFDAEKDFNRVRNSIIHGKILLEKEIGDQGSFHFGPIIDVREVDFTVDDGGSRFITTVFPATSVVYEQLTYLGGEIGFNYKNVDKPSNPHQGIQFAIAANYLKDVDGKDLGKTGLNTNLNLYFPLDNKENFIWAHRVGAGFTFGDEALFYHLQQLGGSNGLRGFRNERFTGESMLYYNTDLRVRLFNFKSFFAPTTFGIYGGFDVGRVWLDTFESDMWHTDFGGGIWLSPFDAVVIKVGFFATEDESGRLLLSLGFDF